MRAHNTHTRTHKELNIHTQADNYRQSSQVDTDTKNIKTHEHTASSFLPSVSLCVSPANGYISARASPGLLSVSNGNSLGKVVPAKSPPPPSPQMVNSRKPDLRVITSQSGKNLMQLVSRTGTTAATQGQTNSQGTGPSQDLTGV